MVPRQSRLVSKKGVFLWFWQFEQFVSFLAVYTELQNTSSEMDERFFIWTAVVGLTLKLRLFQSTPQTWLLRCGSSWCSIQVYRRFTATGHHLFLSDFVLKQMADCAVNSEPILVYMSLIFARMRGKSFPLPLICRKQADKCIVYWDYLPCNNSLADLGKEPDRPFFSLKCLWTKFFLHFLVVHYVLIPKWQEKMDGKKQKSIFLPLKVPKNDQNRVSEDCERVWPRSLAVWRHKSRRMFVSLVFVKCSSDETYIFLANIDVLRKPPTTEENAKTQLEAISKMCGFWVCRPWIKPKQRQQQSCAKQDGELNCWDWLTFGSTGLTGLKEKLPELNGLYFYVLLTRNWRSRDFRAVTLEPWLYFFCSERRYMHFNYSTQTDATEAQVYGVLVCNLICSCFHRFSLQEKDRLSCSALTPGQHEAWSGTLGITFVFLIQWSSNFAT